jgi:hypothetical protein
MNDYDRGKALAELLNRYKFTKHDQVKFASILTSLLLLAIVYVLARSPGFENFSRGFLLAFNVLPLIALLVAYSMDLMKKQVIEKNELNYIQAKLGWSDLPISMMMFGLPPIFRYSSNQFYKGFLDNYWLGFLIYLYFLLILLPFMLFATYIVLVWLGMKVFP